MTKEERKEYMRNYRIENRERLNELERKWYAENIEKARETRKRWYVRNNEKRNETQREYRSANIEKVREYHKEYMRKRRVELPWEAHYNDAKNRCSNNNTIKFPRYGGRGIKFKLTKDEVKTLYLRDNAKDMYWASIDRINSDGNYAFNNCRFIEQAENSRLGAIERWENR